MAITLSPVVVKISPENLRWCRARICLLTTHIEKLHGTVMSVLL